MHLHVWNISFSCAFCLIFFFGFFVVDALLTHSFTFHAPRRTLIQLKHNFFQLWFDAWMVFFEQIWMKCRCWLTMTIEINNRARDSSASHYFYYFFFYSFTTVLVLVLAFVCHLASNEISAQLKLEECMQPLCHALYLKTKPLGLRYRSRATLSKQWQPWKRDIAQHRANNLVKRTAPRSAPWAASLDIHDKRTTAEEIAARWLIYFMRFVMAMTREIIDLKRERERESKRKKNKWDGKTSKEPVARNGNGNGNGCGH